MATKTPDSAVEELSARAPLKGSANDLREISLLDLLIEIAERKRFILKITAGFAIVAAIVSLLLPKKYTAKLVLLPPQQNSSLGTQLASQFGGLGGMAALATGGGSSLLKNPNDMYVSMLKSRTVEDAMVNRFGLMQEYHKKLLSDTRAALEKHTIIDGNGKDGLIRISVEDWNPQRAADLANGYVDQFRYLSEHLAITEAAQRRLFFEAQMQKTKDDLANAEAALTETERKTGLIQLDSQTRALIESAANLRAQITAKEVQIHGMETYATGENSELIQARQELDGLRAQMARLGGNEEIPGGGIIPAKGQMTASEMEYVRRLRDVKYYETIFDILARQFELAKLDEARQGAAIQVVDPAVPPDRRSFPHRAIIVLAGAIIGAFIAMLITLLTASFRRLGDAPETAERWSRLRFLLSFRSKRGHSNP